MAGSNSSNELITFHPSNTMLEAKYDELRSRIMEVSRRTYPGIESVVRHTYRFLSAEHVLPSILDRVNWIILGNPPFDRSSIHKMAGDSSMTAMLELLILIGTDVNGQDEAGDTPLHIAVRMNHQENIELLIRYGASILICNKKGIHPLHVALTYGRLECVRFFTSIISGNIAFETTLALVKYLVSRESELNISSSNLLTLLCFSFNVDDEETFNFLLKEYPLLDLQTTSILHSGRINYINSSIDHGVNFNARMKWWGSPLLYVCDLKFSYMLMKKSQEYSRCDEIIQLLIDNGADMSIRNAGNESSLHLALKCRDNFKFVQCFLNRGADINARTVENDTPLHYAVAPRECNTDGYANFPEFPLCSETEDRFELLELLLHSGAEVNAKNIRGETPLHLAARYHDNVDFLQYLIKYGADANARNKANETPLHHALKFGKCYNVIKILLDSGSDTNVQNNDGESPLQLAISIRNDLTIVELLLNKGANVNATSLKFKKQTCLHHCVRFGKSIYLAKLLLGRGADLNAKDFGNVTPIHLAIMLRNDPELIQFFLENGAEVNTRSIDNSTPLHDAIRFNYDFKIIESILESGVEVNARAFMERTPIHYCIQYNKPISFFKLLLKHNADVNGRDSKNNTPIHTALMRKRSSEIVRLLLDNGAKANTINSTDETPLHHAIQFQFNLRIIKLLVAKGADVNARNFLNETPLHSILDYNGSFEIWKFLVDNGAKISGIDFANNGLHKCVSNPDSIQFVKYFLRMGADIENKDSEGETILHKACKRDNLGLIEFLIEMKANINTTNNKHFTPVNSIIYKLSKYPSSDGFRNSMIRLKYICALMTKMGYENKYISVGNNSQSERVIMNNFRKECEEEISRLFISQIVVHNAATFYDILIGDISTHLMLYRNKNVRLILESGAYKNHFPMYGEIIGNKIEKAKTRMKLIDLSVDLFIKNVFLKAVVKRRQCNIPINIFEQIVSYLDEDDLRSMIDSLT